MSIVNFTLPQNRDRSKPLIFHVIAWMDIQLYQLMWKPAHLFQPCGVRRRSKIWRYSFMEVYFNGKNQGNHAMSRPMDLWPSKPRCVPCGLFPGFSVACGDPMVLGSEHHPAIADSESYQGIPQNGHVRYGYGSIPINTIFSGMNIHLPAILMFTRGTRFWPIAISK